MAAPTGASTGVLSRGWIFCRIRDLVVPLLFQSGYHPTLPPRSRERTSDGVYKLGWFNSNIRLDLFAGLEGWPSINPGTVTRRGDAALKRCLQEIPVRLRGPAPSSLLEWNTSGSESARRKIGALRAALFLVRWSSLEWTPPCHGGDHGFKSHTDRACPGSSIGRALD